MKDENEPVTPDEFVLRLIWGDYLKPRAIPISPKAFGPRSDEKGGISVFRAQCLGRPERALEVIAEDKRARYGIAKLLVADLAALGLTVRPEPIPNIPGHAVLPELNIVSSTDDPARWRALELQLAELASRNLIVRPTE